jgi:hypothetical protein
MARGGMSSERIASTLGIEIEVFSAWVSRLDAARALDPETVDNLLYPPKQPPPPPRHDPRVIAERVFEAAE